MYETESNETVFISMFSFLEFRLSQFKNDLPPLTYLSLISMYLNSEEVLLIIFLFKMLPLKSNYLKRVWRKEDPLTLLVGI